jgi:hypothetical protein
MEATQPTQPTEPTPKAYKKRETSITPIPDGVIYKLESVLAKLVYYGSSENIDKRMAHHRMAYERFKTGNCNNRCVYKVMEQPDCKLTILERKPFDNAIELQKRESYYISTFPCVNERSSFGVVKSKNPKINLKEPQTKEQIYKQKYNAEYRKRPEVIERERARIKNPEYKRQLYDQHNNYKRIIYARKKIAKEEEKALTEAHTETSLKEGV